MFHCELPNFYWTILGSPDLKELFLMVFLWNLPPNIQRLPRFGRDVAESLRTKLGRVDLLRTRGAEFDGSTICICIYIYIHIINIYVCSPVIYIQDIHMFGNYCSFSTQSQPLIGEKHTKRVLKHNFLTVSTLLFWVLGFERTKNGNLEAQ